MAEYIRSNAWNNNGTFDNQDLYWYARGVGVMQSRALDNQNSWWFFAAIHGEYITNNNSQFPGWAFIPPVPNVPTSPLPAQGDINTYWDQCQHQSWYFPPWHRGYLIALEAQVREAIIGLGGPATWALPYWNYLGQGNEYLIPPAFTERNLPDGTSNPLYVTARFGPKGDGNIYIPIPPVNNDCLSNDLYTGSNANTPIPGFGGPQTGFSHGGAASGNLENNPHNLVHVDVGGQPPNNPNLWGLMADPGIAALDPVFYLHHSNIDRMWAVWNAAGYANPTNPNWLQGPPATGGREFIMPMPGAVPWVYTPADVDSLDLLNYTYDDLSTASNQVSRLVKPLSVRMARLGVATLETSSKIMAENSQYTSELVGAHDGALTIGSAGVRASIKLDNKVRNKLVSTFAAASMSKLPDRAYLQIENVQGTRDANKLNIYVNGHSAGCVALFGLRKASMADGEHGGSGLTFHVDITKVIDTLHLENALNTDSLDIRIIPESSIPEGSELSVGRISVYREGAQ